MANELLSDSDIELYVKRYHKELTENLPPIENRVKHLMYRRQGIILSSARVRAILEKI